MSFVFVIKGNGLLNMVYNFMFLSIKSIRLTNDYLIYIEFLNFISTLNPQVKLTFIF